MAGDGEQPALLNGMPWWIKAVSYVGFPIAAAAVTMYILFTMLQPHVLETHQDHDGMTKALNSLSYTNQIMCQNSAPDKATAEKCVQPPPK